MIKTKTLLTLFALLFFASPAFSGNRTITYYRDGALVEIEATAVKGIVKIPLTGTFIESSLRIKPTGNAVIQGVEILRPPLDTKAGKELETLTEQKQRLEDRLQALATREEIFKSAAKSQSGKAPRKSKTNPDPLQSIRQGTDFAMAQLEAVYSARRKTEQEIRRLETRIATLKKGTYGAEQVAQISISPQNGSVRAAFVQKGSGWIPSYNIRITGNGQAELTQFATLQENPAGYTLKASPSALGDNTTEPAVTIITGQTTPVARHLLTTADEAFGIGPLSGYSLVLNNKSGSHIPAGEATLYRNGEYWGKLRFEGISSGKSRILSSGR